MKVKVGVSNRHCHLTKELYYELFGKEELTWKKNLNQVGQYATCETVIIKGPKNEIKNVRILGPFRSYNQVEVSKTDCYYLGIEAPVRKSGDLKDAGTITIVGPLKEVTLPVAIIANRHIHINSKDASKLGILDGDAVQIKIDTEKKGIIEASYKVSDDGYFELHLDTDDANCFLLKQDSEVEILK